MCGRNNCFECPLGPNSNGKDKSCRVFVNNYPSEAIEIVQKWSNENSGTLAKWEINSDGYYPYCSDCGFEPEKNKSVLSELWKDNDIFLELMEKGKLKE